jgi:hypothetical protein
LSQRGQASVELVGVLPFVIAVLLVVWQLALAGHTAWLAANAARVAARAQLVGDDPVAAARSALPAGLERGFEVEHRDEATRVAVPIPFVHHGWSAPLKVSATASLESVE